MAKIVLVLYDDPVEGYPTTYAREDLPKVERYSDGQTLPTPKAMTMEREPNNKGDRVKMSMSGKFLPYKCYGNDDGMPEYGVKEG